MPTSRYTEIVDDLSQAIRDGRLSPGTRLPTHRDLARRHGIALATATRGRVRPACPRRPGGR